MAEDAKVAKNRRLAEALRANLKRRKAAARAASAKAHGDGETLLKRAETGAAPGDGGMD